MLFDVHPPDEGGRDGQENGGEREVVQGANPEAEEDKERAGVGGVADVTVGSGLDELVIVRDRDVYGEKPAEIDDRDPTDDQPEDEKDEPDEVEGVGAWQAALRQCAAEEEAGKDTGEDHGPEERQGPPISAGGAAAAGELGALGEGEHDLGCEQEPAESGETW